MDFDFAPGKKDCPEKDGHGFHELTRINRGNSVPSGSKIHCSGFAFFRVGLPFRHAAVERNFLDGGGAGHFCGRCLVRVNI